MFKPKVEFLFDNIEAETEYLCFLAKNITLKRYQKGGFLVLPHLIPGNLSSVYFPNFPFTRNFWSLIQKCNNEDYRKEFPHEAINEIQKYLKDQRYSKTERYKVDNLISEWQKYKKPFLDFVNNHFDQKSKLNMIKSISILFTKYGTRGSFNIQKNYSGTRKFAITHRIDFETDELAKTILKAIYLLQSKKRAEVGEVPFYERQKAVEYLFRNSQLANIFPRPKKSRIINNTKNLIKDSRSFLTKLGFPPGSPFDIINNKIYLNKRNIDTVFTTQEKVLLSGLITKNGELLSFDEASELVWKERSFDKFSLASLAKIIENLRKKFRQSGLNSEIIKTVRNRGYFLTS